MWNKASRKLASVGLTLPLLAFAACGSDGGGGGETEGGSGGSEGDVAVRIGTASAAGTFYAMAAGLAQTLNEETDLNVTAQTTPGSSAPNVAMLQTGDIQFGYVTSDQAQQGYRGERSFAEANEGLRAVAAGNLAEIQLVASADSGITSIEDLEGARIGAGSEGSLTEYTTSVIMDAYGIEDWTPVYGSNEDNLNGLRDGTIDAVNSPLAAPSPGLTEVGATVDLEWLPLDPAMVEKITTEYSFWVPTSIEAGVYDSLEEEYTTFAYPTLLVAQDTLDDEIVVKVLETLYGNSDELQDVHPAFAQWVPENADRGVTIPFHAGAEKYFGEQGVELQTSE